MSQRPPRFTSSEFDKYTNKTTIKWNDPLHGKMWAKWDYYIYELSYKVGDKSFRATCTLTPRMVKVGNVESIVFDYNYSSSDWIFLRNGNLIVHIPGGQNITLLPTESDTKVFSGNVEEYGYYQVSKEELKAIADAENISVRLSGDSTAFELKEKALLKFQFMARSFYADVYEDSSYDPWIESIVGNKTATKSSNGSGGSSNFGCTGIVILSLILFYLFSC